jgi:3-hydroxyacyl-CoA dehydrogenase/enoyl-CoA hydratase/3-hydroxybutyryl-CoA epimerase/enoyl-CoA isomerase
MLFQGKTITVEVDSNQIARMVFDSPDSVNKFNAATTEELRESTQLLAKTSGIKGLTITSKKDSFIVGADITEFSAMFTEAQELIEEAVVDYNSIFSALQNLPFPTVTVLDGIALGGGFELALATDFRIASNNAKVGLPEVKLGINPGFGGTIRLPRLIGIDNAVEWIATGNEYKPAQALAVGAIDALVEQDDLLAAADQLIQDCNNGDIDFQARKDEKSTPVKLSDMERIMAFTTAKGLVASQAGPHMPAPVTSVKSIEQSAALTLEDAVKIEAKFFARLAKTDVSRNLVALFLNEQSLSKRTAAMIKETVDSKKLAVIGAGIMGGGIAYQAAYKGVPTVMKDVAQAGLDLGMNEATKLLAKRVDRGRMSATQMADTLNRIEPTLHYSSFGGENGVDVVVEAVVENLKVKQAVLADVEQQVAEGTVISSNTSTLSITNMAKSLKHPELFCGMHFFNPVHRMPLVEVIRGEKTSDTTTAKVVKLAKQMGKTPIVVNDCPGFYVNRVLFPYFAGFNHLIIDGADFQAVDKVMEKFGWPMGPAYLIDVVGIDTACHAAEVMAEGFPSRMSYSEKTPIEHVFADNRLGQKNETGFYRYELDKKGKPRKIADSSTYDLLKPSVKASNSFTDEEIIERMMIPMLFEVVRCLEEGIVSDPVDADMGLLMGIGFPLFRGGPIRYLESIGVSELIAMSEKYSHLGELYQAPELLKTMAANGETFYGSKGGAQ